MTLLFSHRASVCKPSRWLTLSPHALPHTAVFSVCALVPSLYLALKMKAVWFHAIKELTILSCTSELSCIFRSSYQFPVLFHTRKRSEVILAFLLWILSLDYVRAASPFIFPCRVLWPISGWCLLLWGAVGFLLPLEREKRRNSPPLSALKLKCVSEICLALIGRGGKRFSCPCLPLFYFEAIKHLHCMALYASQAWEPAERIWWNKYLRQLRGRLEHRLSYQSLYDLTWRSKRTVMGTQSISIRYWRGHAWGFLFTIKFAMK